MGLKIFGRQAVPSVARTAASAPAKKAAKAGPSDSFSTAAPRSAKVNIGGGSYMEQPTVSASYARSAPGANATGGAPSSGNAASDQDVQNAMDAFSQYVQNSISYTDSGGNQEGAPGVSQATIDQWNTDLQNAINGAGDNLTTDQLNQLVQQEESKVASGVSSAEMSDYQTFITGGGKTDDGKDDPNSWTVKQYLPSDQGTRLSNELQSQFSSIDPSLPASQQQAGVAAIAAQYPGDISPSDSPEKVRAELGNLAKMKAQFYANFFKDFTNRFLDRMKSDG